MSSSELSNALNPCIVQSKARLSPTQYQAAHETNDHLPINQHNPHNIEFDSVIINPRSLPTRPQNDQKQRLPSTANVQLVQELLRIMTATRESQEIEHDRRLAWEQELEKKYLQKQTEMESLIREMREEITALRSVASPLSDSECTAFVQSLSSQSLLSSQLSQRPTPLPSLLQRKRRISSEPYSEDENGTSASDSYTTVDRKRVNLHDQRCITIHAALRKHILLVMRLDKDDELPDSHVEGMPLSLNDPVRFVWEKTTKQSAHNVRMKARVLADLEANRSMYRHVSRKEFSKRNLESAFEAVYTTIRQRFKTQRNSSFALHQKRREDIKARKARHLSRRKIKLGNRSEARMKLAEFTHIIFDGALQLECMSSEESEEDDLCTRGYGWRSSRLLRFYKVLDEEDKNMERLKRGIGRKWRRLGPVKEGFQLPPRGIASWMVSQKWIRDWEIQYSDLRKVVAGHFQELPGYSWHEESGLGDISSDDV